MDQFHGKLEHEQQKTNSSSTVIREIWLSEIHTLPLGLNLKLHIPDRSEYALGMKEPISPDTMEITLIKDNTLRLDTGGLDA